MNLILKKDCDKGCALHPGLNDEGKLERLEKYFAPRMIEQIRNIFKGD